MVKKRMAAEVALGPDAQKDGGAEAEELARRLVRAGYHTGRSSGEAAMWLESGRGVSKKPSLDVIYAGMKQMHEVSGAEFKPTFDQMLSVWEAMVGAEDGSQA